MGDQYGRHLLEVRTQLHFFWKNTLFDILKTETISHIITLLNFWQEMLVLLVWKYFWISHQNFSINFPSKLEN